MVHMQLAMVFEEPVFQLIFDQGAHVDVGDLDEDFQCYEVDDGVVYVMLVEQNIQIHNLSHNIDMVSNKWDGEGNIGMRKLVWVVNSILHQLHGSPNFGIKPHMKGARRDELDQEQSVVWVDIQGEIFVSIYDGH